MSKSQKMTKEISGTIGENDMFDASSNALVEYGPAEGGT